MAIGALDALRGALGLRVPEDVLVAGFDDVPEASWGAYDLTTVVQDGSAMVAEAMEILKSMLSSSSSGGRTDARRAGAADRTIDDTADRLNAAP